MIKFLNGNYEVTTKKDHYPNRINVEDLAKIILVSIQNHEPKRIINATDQKNITTYDAIDYVADELKGSAFVISNPNAKSTCGCGSSAAF